EHSVEIGAHGLGHHVHLVVGHHAVGSVHAVHAVGSGRVDVPVVEPGVHLVDLGSLGGVDLLREGDHGRIVTVGNHQFGHLDGLFVVRDHALYEGDVGVVHVVGKFSRSRLPPGRGGS